jgi:cyclopropane fatty-acyl-phospholipid synthase-like methyltransferase
MEPALFFAALESVNEKPRPFSVYTANDLWTDRHTSAQMLAYHLDGGVDVSSRRTSFIDDSVRWLAQHFELTDASTVIDFGCGPGLYTHRIARHGVEVTGIDFSSRSIEYARSQARQANLRITYIEADYLGFEPDGTFDLVTLIMCDFCALSPEQRQQLLAKFRRILSDRGRIVLDVYSMTAFAERQDGLVVEKNQLNGFWSVNPYYGFVASFKYDDEKVGLDKYTIVEQGRQRQVYNWLQYFTPESLEREAEAAGLQVTELLGDVAGNPYDAGATEFAAVLKSS